MNILSNNFKNNGIIEKQFTCNGEGVSLHLAWNNFPPETKSFALICNDPDSSSGNFVHWMAVNIPSNITEINEGAMVVPNSTNLNNSFGKIGYGTPCPPSGIHRYIFSIYALNTEKIEGVNENNFYEKIKPYIIEEGQITAKYGK